MIALVWWLGASIALASEMDSVPSTDGLRQVGPHTVLVEGGVLSIDGDVVGRVLEQPAANDVGVAAAAEHGSQMALWWIPAVGAPRVVLERGSIDRVAVAPDGSGLVFASPNEQGVAALWWLETADPSVGPVSLTNPVVPGWQPGSGPPPGFVPLPTAGRPVVGATSITWASPLGTHSAPLPTRGG